MLLSPHTNTLVDQSNDEMLVSKAIPSVLITHALNHTAFMFDSVKHDVDLGGRFIKETSMQLRIGAMIDVLYAALDC